MKWVMNGLNVPMMMDENARRTCTVLIYTSSPTKGLCILYCAIPHIFRPVRHSGLIGSTVKLEMKARHRTSTMGFSVLVARPGLEANCGDSLPVAVRRDAFNREPGDTRSGTPCDLTESNIANIVLSNLW